jgi:hypothetical protein
MKKLPFLMLCVLLSTFCTAQTLINGQTSKSEIAEMDTMKIMYAHVLLTENGDNYLGIVDAGNGIRWVIANSDNKRYKGFKSPAQLFNFMYDNQWEYTDTIENVSSTGALGQILFGVNVAKTKFVYVFKRRKS